MCVHSPTWLLERQTHTQKAQAVKPTYWLYGTTASQPCDLHESPACIYKSGIGPLKQQHLHVKHCSPACQQRPALPGNACACGHHKAAVAATGCSTYTQRFLHFSSHSSCNEHGARNTYEHNGGRVGVPLTRHYVARQSTAARCCHKTPLPGCVKKHHPRDLHRYRQKCGARQCCTATALLQKWPHTHSPEASTPRACRAGKSASCLLQRTPNP